MARENVEIVQAVFEQFARGDFSWTADVADDQEFATGPPGDKLNLGMAIMMGSLETK